MQSGDINTAILDAQLLPFGLRSDSLNDLLYDTGAVLAGGAVVHYLYNTHSHAAPREPDPTSDLDFWVYDPMLSLTAEQRYDAQHAIRVYRDSIERRFAQTLGAAGFIQLSQPPKDKVGQYEDVTEHFAAQGGTLLTVKWWHNAETGRWINLMYMSKPPREAIPLFDIPLCRAMMWGSTIKGFLIGSWSRVALDDIKSRALTLPTGPICPKTQQRLKKYMNRYGLTPRGSIDVHIISNADGSI